MKRLFTSLVIIFLSVNIFASVNVYTPTLVAPVNDAQNQMPDVLLNWGPVSGTLGLYYKVQIDTDTNFNSPLELTTNLTAIQTTELNFNGTYFWKVKAIDNIDSSDWSEFRSFTVISKVVVNPMAVNVLNCYTVSTISSLKAIINWTSITGITHYEYELDTIPSFNSTFLKSGNISKDSLKIDFFEHVNFSLYSNLTYFFRIKAVHTQDFCDWSDIIIFNTCNSMPNAPDLTSPTNMAVNRPLALTLDWMPLTDATSYIIEYSIDMNFTSPTTLTLVPVSTNITFLDNSRISITGLVNNQTYYWRVKSVKNNDMSLWSEVWSFSTIDTVLGVPSLVSPIDLATNVHPSVELEWTADPLAVSYIIEYDVDALFTTADTLTSTTNAKTLVELLFDTEYFWRVKSVNATDTSVWSSVNSFTVIEMPQQLLPMDMSTGAAFNEELSWEEIDGVNDYLVQIDTTALFNSALLIDSIVTNPHIILDATTFSTPYFWRVKAMHDADTSEWSLIWTFVTLDTMPASPVLVSPADASINLQTEVLLEWTNVGGAILYNIEYDTDPLFSNPISEDVNDNYFHLNDLVYGETYHWRVRSIGVNDTSMWSANFSFIVHDNILQTSPADASINMPLAVILKWEPVYGATHYECEVDTTLFFNSTILTNYTINNDLPVVQAFTVQNLFGTTYYWRVRAFNASGASDWSNSWSFVTTDELVLATPEDGATGVMPNVSLKSINLDGVLTYQFEIDTVNTFDSFLYTLSVASADVPFVSSATSELKFNQKYFWRSRARIGMVYSNWSDIWEFTTIDKVNPTAPANASNVSNVSPILKWDEIEGITHYVLEIDTTAAFSTAASYDVTAPAKELTVLYSTLVSGKMYHWRIKAVHASDESDWSDVRTFNFSYTVGIENNSIGNSLSMYPNPSNGFVNFQITLDKSEALNMEILDITGRIVYNDVLNLRQGLNTKAMNLSFLSQGIYIINLKNDNVNLNRKLILNN
ncbi:MAG: T9SS type A sorting domain-containing protein [Bacteroidales bacterium]|nr:T9SS type A sorting domain-containing protein [Bacteroidales bacterium]